MAVDCKDHGTIGCAYYVAKEERLFCMQDVPKGSREIVDRLKLDIQPTLLLLSTRIDSKLDLTAIPADDDTRTTHTAGHETELRPNPDFSYEDAQMKLANLNLGHTEQSIRFLVPGENENVNEHTRADEIGLTDRPGNLMQISASLDLDSQVSIGCMGAAIGCLQRKRASEYLPNDADASNVYKIASVDLFAFHNTMFVNADTLSALQIIMPETHPNVFNQGPGTTGSKESLSVYGLFHSYARTPQGKARLRQLFLRPSLDKEEINGRLDFVSILTRPDNHTALDRLSKSLSKIKNLRSTMAMLRRGIEAGTKYSSFKSGVWSTLLEFCYYAIDIVDALHEVAGAERLLICSQVTETLDKFRLKQVGRHIYEVVDLELSQEQHRTVVKRGVDENLDQIKDVYDGMDELLSQVAVDIARGMPQDLDCRINVIFFPQLGFHITVPLNELTMQPVWDGDGLWERMFTTQNTAYFKEDKTRLMDQEIGDLWANICDIEIELVYDLAQRVLEDQQLMLASSDVLGELDCLLALAHGAVAHQLVRPRIVDDNVISVTGGRHILQEMVVPSYVPNNASLRGGDCDNDEYRTLPTMTVLTGPNYSGKSIYQNSVAIIAYMAQVGSFVPAERATLGITDKILTRISTTETVSKTHSAFMIDLQQAGLGLNSCTNRSLIIIDEFGKGTDTADGAGLMAGVLQYLLELDLAAPKVLAATHFHEVFELGLFGDDEPNLKHAHMEVRVDKRDDTTTLTSYLTTSNGKQPAQSTRSTTSNNNFEPAERVTYLYQLDPGRSTLSYGAQCAAMNGIPGPVIERAVELGQCLARGQDLVSMCSRLSRQETEDLKVAERTARRFLAEDFEVDFVDEEGVNDVLDAILGEIDGKLGGNVGQEDRRSVDELDSDAVTVTEYSTTN
ncbi:uncharacterized protein AB675_9898 [Cyphellophora attinorum]|uniref:DNA mismatch repair proteins mutS family domain-containing protein n=1 Tax=Cyphellophora attinorum TaxID=1664694 RepID=A0A0N0NI62_9EURO|nr:uncharacterized protein AB675_9898 [Phialophora attinorum]KPI35358.1 hypothetical protein AB675_9898 [Phialophora attinorum]